MAAGEETGLELTQVAEKTGAGAAIEFAQEAAKTVAGTATEFAQEAAKTVAGRATEFAQVAAKTGAEEMGKQGAKSVTEAMMKVGEAAISHTITAKRSVVITILNESDLTLDKPCWEMKHGHAASEGLPPEKISKSTSEKGVVMRFVKPRVSAYGCVGVLLYRYQNTLKDENYLAIRFKVPGAGQNKCAIAILSEGDLKASENVRSFDFVTPKLYKYLKKKYFKDSKLNNIQEIRSKSCKWMEVSDKKKEVVFGCTMSGEDHAAIKVKISKQR